MEKARLLLVVDIKWGAEAVMAGGRGLAKAGDSSFCLGPAASKQQMLELVTAKGWGDSFAILALTSRAIPLRLPSEFLSLDRAIKIEAVR